MKIYAENKQTKEVYECNKPKIVADIQSHFKISQLEAEVRIKYSTINEPIELDDCVVWSE